MAQQFSAVEAALEGFRLMKRQPMALVGWAGLQLVGSILGLAMTIGLMGQAMTDLASVGTGEQFNPAAFGRGMAATGVVTLLTMPVSLAWMSIAYAAIYRAVLRPEQSAAFYLRLGGDELRQFLVLLLLTVIVFGGPAVLITGGSLALAAWGAGGGLLLAAAILMAIPLMLFLMVRLSLAPAETLATGKVRILSAWDMTRGHFWGIFGAYTVTIIILMVLSTVSQTLVNLISGNVLNQMTMSMAGGGGDAVAFARSHAPQFTLWVAVSAVFNTAQLVVLLAPGAAIYGALAGRGVAVAETFA